MTEEKINLFNAEWNIKFQDVNTDEILHEETSPNIIVRAGRKDIFYHLFNLTGAISGTGFIYMGVGSSTTAATVVDTTLGAELTANNGTGGNPNGRVVCTNTSQVALAPSDVVQETSGSYDQKIILQAIFLGGDLNNGSTFAEYGLFSAQPFGTGTMFNHYISSSPFTKSSSVRAIVQVTFRV